MSNKGQNAGGITVKLFQADSRFIAAMFDSPKSVYHDLS